MPPVELPAPPVVLDQEVVPPEGQEGCGFPPNAFQRKPPADQTNDTKKDTKKIQDMTIAEFVEKARSTMTKRQDKKARLFGFSFERKGNASTFVRFLESQEIFSAADFVTLSEKTVESLMGRSLIEHGGSLALLDAMYKLRSDELKRRKRMDNMREDYNSPREVKDPVKFILVHAEVEQINEVDVVAQRFKARVIVQFRVKDGAKDKTLAEGGDEFPFDDEGNPTFLAPIGWYMKQFDVYNSVSGEPIEWLMRHNMVEGDDLLITLRFAGMFAEDFELNAFPFDIQALQIRLFVDCCKREGRMPVEIEVQPSEDKAPNHFVRLGGFQVADEWDVATMPKDGKILRGSLYAVPYEIETYDHKGRQATFSSLRLTATIRRKATFYVTNIMIQVMLLTGLGLMQFFLPSNVPEERMAVTLTMVLAIVGFK